MLFTFCPFQYPTNESTEVEEDVMEYCKLVSDISPAPVVDLAV